MRIHLKLAHQAIILIAVPLLFQLVFFVARGWLQREAEYAEWRQTLSKNVVVVASELYSSCQQAFMTVALFAGWHNQAVESRYRMLSERIPKQVELLKSLAAGDPGLTQLVDRAESVSSSGLKQMAQYMYQYSHGIRVNHVLQRLRMIQFGNDIMHSVSAISDRESKMAADPFAEARLRLSIENLLLAALGFNCTVAVVLAVFFNTVTTRRLNTLMDNTYRLASGVALHPTLSGGDEIAHLDRVFHRMANELNEAARKERAIVENALDVICTVESGNKFGRVSPASREVFGYDPEELAGRNFLELVLPEDVETTREALSHVIAGKSNTVIENRIVRKNGTIADLRWSAHWSESEKSLFCVAHDITDRKQLERLKQEFVSMISHDLRTPLTSVQLDLSLMSAGISGELPARALKNVEQAEKNIAYVMSLIGGLLDIERMTVGKLEMHFVPTNVSAIFQRSQQAVGPLAVKRQVNLIVEPQDIQAVADEDRLLQVVINLLSNAVKFSNAGGTVTLSAADLGESIEVRVKDQGRGIPESHKEAIFQRFEQVDPSDASEKKGAGLGLAICKAIVEQHGGTIGVESEEGMGSLFRFRFPKRQSD